MRQKFQRRFQDELTQLINERSSYSILRTMSHQALWVRQDFGRLIYHPKNCEHQFRSGRYLVPKTHRFTAFFLLVLLLFTLKVQYINQLGMGSKHWSVLMTNIWTMSTTYTPEQLTTRGHLKMDTWKFGVSFWKPSIFNTHSSGSMCYLYSPMDPSTS